MTPEDKQLFYYEGRRNLEPFTVCLQALMNCGPDPKVTKFWRDCLGKALPFLRLGEKMIIASETDEQQPPKEPDPPEPSEPKLAPVSSVKMSPEAEALKDNLQKEFGLDFASVVEPTT